MHRAIRTQIDQLGDDYSRAGALDCTSSKDMARQEFKDDADINIMLSRFGVNQQQRTTTPFGEADYTIDLQQAMHSINQTQRAYQRMDPEIKRIYPTYEQFIKGVATGDLKKDLARIAQEKNPSHEEGEIRRELERQKKKEQLQRDDEAAEIAAQHRVKKTPAAEVKP